MGYNNGDEFQKINSIMHLIHKKKINSHNIENEFIEFFKYHILLNYVSRRYRFFKEIVIQSAALFIALIMALVADAVINLETSLTTWETLLILAGIILFFLITLSLFVFTILRKSELHNNKFIEDEKTFDEIWHNAYNKYSNYKASRKNNKKTN